VLLLRKPRRSRCTTPARYLPTPANLFSQSVCKTPLCLFVRLSLWPSSMTGTVKPPNETCSQPFSCQCASQRHDFAGAASMLFVWTCEAPLASPSNSRMPSRVRGATAADGVSALFPLATRKNKWSRIASRAGGVRMLHPSQVH
jgi:hypothetical protein